MGEKGEWRGRGAGDYKKDLMWEGAGGTNQRGKKLGTDREEGTSHCPAASLPAAWHCRLLTHPTKGSRQEEKAPHPQQDRWTKDTQRKHPTRRNKTKTKRKNGG